ncbi:hypothetical protein PsorP6_003237 [Peronosclerospora sorghi]|uniref:Uncharacterized protein n=1 Tax=Peronosclerospora sorghi TaxID=230839 RepID=A0ACC0VKT4_9STRA|nr:hypothetical protein PsorP6_003237 [Peronosclerospora sorghi]
MPARAQPVNVASLVLLLGGVAAVLAAFLARSGFTGRAHVVGIDLGTTYSVVAIAQQKTVHVIPDADGAVLIPSTVAYLPHGNVLVGHKARAHRTIDPKHTIFNAKRFIGQRYETVVHELATWPYEFQVKAHADGSVCFALDVPGHPDCVTPIDVGAAVVRYLRTMATRFVGHTQLTKAVVAVPVDFDATRRNATVAAFHAAGFHVSRVLEEPTAAAIAYGLHHAPNASFVLVFDFGGGTLDVSLLFARQGAINVVDTLGDNHLGGEDLDAALTAWLVKELETQGGGRPLASLETEGWTQAEEEHTTEQVPPCTLAGVRVAAEALKRQLTYAATATASCMTRGDASGPPVRAHVEMTRAQLEALCRPLLDRTMLPVRDILAANHMQPDDIDAVVLVGGSSRLPWVRARLTAMFHGRAPLSDIDPDLAVAYGAARTLD